MESSIAPDSLRFRVIPLVAIHIFAGIVLAGLLDLLHGPPLHLYSPVLFGAFHGLAFGQIGLLVLWAALATAAWCLRLVGVFVGAAVIGAAVGFADTGFDPSGILFAAFEAVMVAVFALPALLLVRHVGLRITVTREACVSDSGVQFSIRHLAAATLVVCLAAALARLLMSHPTSRDFLRDLIYDLREPMLFSIPYSVVVTTAFPLLGTRFPLLFAAVFILVAGALGFGFAALLRFNETYWTATTLTQGLSLAGSLCVLRNGKLRLVRPRADQPKSR
jgi:hypothetical protein